jgi:serine/threonine-protein kinase
VFDFGQTPEGTLYYAMEHLNGVTLEDLVRISGPQPATRVLGILDQVCGSLREAHARGLIHRDIKPTNIMLCEHGGLHDVVKVLDFGLVKEIQEDTPDLTQAKAQQWWSNNRSSLPMEQHADSHSPLSDTGLLVDV